MKVYGNLERASIESRTSNVTGAASITGLIWWRSDTSRLFMSDGTNAYAILRNDGKAIIGNSATTSQNIRLHRGAAGVLQFTTEADTTAEGSLSTSLNQISARLENYTDGSKPSAANAGRLIWTTDISKLQVDTGASWVQINTSLTNIFDFVIGSAAQVTAGTATHSTWASAIAAASAGDTIQVLEGTWTENVTVDKQLHIEGNGYGTNLTGSITFSSSSDKSSLDNVRMSDNLTLDSGADLISVNNIWFATGKSFVDNGTGNLLSGFQE